LLKNQEISEKCAELNGQQY